MSCDVGHRRCSNPELLWLWCRPAAAALIRPQPGNLHMPRVRPKKRQKKKKTPKIQVLCVQIAESLSQPVDGFTETKWHFTGLCVTESKYGRFESVCCIQRTTTHNNLKNIFVINISFPYVFKKYTCIGEWQELRLNS